MATDGIFGCWLMTTTGACHYSLSGKFLCDTAESPDTTTKPVPATDRCPMCLAKNGKRWQEMYKTVESNKEVRCGSDGPGDGAAVSGGGFVSDPGAG